MKMALILTFLVLGMATTPAFAQQIDAKIAGRPSAGKTEMPVELGLVRWNRDLDNAKKQSAKSGKPVLLLFQEVPG